MRVIGFDISFRTGWAVLETDDSAKYGVCVVAAGVIPKTRGTNVRVSYSKSGIDLSDYVGVEDTFPTGGSGYLIEVSKRVGEIRALASCAGKELVEIHPATMRSFVKTGKDVWIECSRCKSVLRNFKSEKQAREQKKLMSEHAIKCPQCKEHFIPRVKTEGKTPVIELAQSIEPFTDAKEDDADAIVLSWMAGCVLGVFPTERLEPWRREVIQRLARTRLTKTPIKKVKRKPKQARLAHISSCRPQVKPK